LASLRKDVIILGGQILQEKGKGNTSAEEGGDKEKSGAGKGKTKNGD